jgi:MarR family transcriptional regulator, organic hydroperoxide resistance regulator
VKNEAVVLQLQRATHATLHRLNHELAHLDLTPSDINALGNLADGVGRTVTELGSAIGSRPATLTGILDRLERRGLIRRGIRPGDRRVVLIELTTKGAKTADLVLRTMLDLEERALAGISRSNVNAARTVLHALAEADREPSH